MELTQVRVQDLLPGDIIDAAHYKYRSTPCWQKVSEVTPWENDPTRFLVWMQNDSNPPFAMWAGKPFSPYDLFTAQRS